MKKYFNILALLFNLFCFLCLNAAIVSSKTGDTLKIQELTSGYQVLLNNEAIGDLITSEEISKSLKILSTFDELKIGKWEDLKHNFITLTMKSHQSHINTWTLISQLQIIRAICDICFISSNPVFLLGSYWFSLPFWIGRYHKLGKYLDKDLTYNMRLFSTLSPILAAVYEERFCLPRRLNVLIGDEERKIDDELFKRYQEKLCNIK